MKITIPRYWVWAWLVLVGALTTSASPPWGFFGHRKINQLAVFTLPAPMAVFFKSQLTYLTEHAVDPDKRRYASPYEAPRHYVDLDRYGTFPFAALPRDWAAALQAYTEIGVLQGEDTLRLTGPQRDTEGWQLQDTLGYQQWFRRVLLPAYPDWSEVTLVPDSLARFFTGSTPGAEWMVREYLSEHGILPYNLLRVQRQLTEAFRKGDVQAILRYSADLGHYLADAHVPLHTTENYNGQLTGQEGIHAFWESRIPEIFADEAYNFWVGPANYLEDPAAYFWEVVLSSHRCVDSVLQVELRLRETFPSEQQYCYESTTGASRRVPCREYAAAYQEALSGMVEQRMRASVKAVGDAWYTAWVDAGQPALTPLLGSVSTPEQQASIDSLEAAFRGGKNWGRAH
ncbi:MAG: hypothetical protein H6555_05635 [Lewinellaceae bacterium]|nr:hypothetical protein [Lewinellaceae bacterium]